MFTNIHGIFKIYEHDIQSHLHSVCEWTGFRPSSRPENWPLSMDSDCAYDEHGSSRYINRRGFSVGLCLNSLPFHAYRSNPFINPKKLQGSDDQSSKVKLKYGLMDLERYIRIVGGYCVDVFGWTDNDDLSKYPMMHDEWPREHVVS